MKIEFPPSAAGKIESLFDFGGQIPVTDSRSQTECLDFGDRLEGVFGFVVAFWFRGNGWIVFGFSLLDRNHESNPGRAIQTSPA